MTSASAIVRVRPRSSPTTELIVNLRIELVAQGLDAGPRTIAWHLEAHHGIDVSAATIRRNLLAAGLVIPEPKKRPKTSYIRFQAELPNECWQSDFTHWRLADGTDTEMLTWLDDHAPLRPVGHRPPPHHRPHRRRHVPRNRHEQGFPASVLTDNALVYTTRFAGGRGGRNPLETRLADLGITQKCARPNHLTTCGKVERFQQTLKTLAPQTTLGIHT